MWQVKGRSNVDSDDVFLLGHYLHSAMVFSSRSRYFAANGQSSPNAGRCVLVEYGVNKVTILSGVEFRVWMYHRKLDRYLTSAA